MFADDPRLAPILNHPAIWRGCNAAPSATLPTGYPALDARLPGRGWPQIGLVEILIAGLGIGELYLVLPALALLTRRTAARWCAWIAPPAGPFAEIAPQSFHHFGSLELCAPALAAHGVSLACVLVVHAEKPLWACEQALRSGACDVVLAWMRGVQPRALRRLQLAAEHGRTLAFLFRTLSAQTLREPSPAALRIAVQPASDGIRLTVLKSRGGSRGDLVVHFGREPRPAADSEAVTNPRPVNAAQSASP
jgi:protein ImuA